MRAEQRGWTGFSMTTESRPFLGHTLERKRTQNQDCRQKREPGTVLCPDRCKGFPTFFSLDLKIYGEFKIGSLPLTGWLKNGIKNRKVRFGLYSTNITNHSNPLAVYNNITSPYFGHFVGFQHRINGFVIDLVD